MSLGNRFHGAQQTDLIVAFDGRNDRGTKTSGDADTKTPNHTANEEIPDHVLLSPSSRFRASQRICEGWTIGFSLRGNEDGKDGRSYDHDASKHYKPHSKEQFLKRFYLANGFFHRSIESDDDGAELKIGAWSMLRSAWGFLDA